MQSTSIRTYRLRGALATGIALTGVVAALAMTGPASASPRPSIHAAKASVGTNIAVAGVHYAKLESLCAPAKPGSVSCFAERRVPVSVKPGTVLPDGVEKYTLSPGPAGGYTPADLATLYDYSRTTGGKGQTIGIVDWYDDPDALADLDHFDANYGFPAETAKTFEKVNENGKSTPLPSASPTSGSSDTTDEISLDIETARAVCSVCKIVLLEANEPTDADLAITEDSAVKLGATEVSNSWGGEEDPFETPAQYASFTNAFKHPGVVITASTGDNGWYSGDYVNDSGGEADEVANTPSTLSSVVSVGGTTLTDSGSRSETVWNENGPEDSPGAQEGALGASGGGCSQVFPAARWQSHVAGYAATGCGTKRLAADVSALADPDTGFDVYDSYDGLDWFTVGGTSLSSPLVASMWALAGGAHGVPYPALTLYGNELTHPSTLHDITVGGNAFCAGVNPTTCATDTTNNYGAPPNEVLAESPLIDCSFASDSATLVTANHQCVAAKGYDGPSGVGTPNGLKAFTPLSPGATIKAPKLRKGHSGKFSEKTTDPFPGGEITKYAWKFGDGKHSASKHPKHTYKKAKTYKVTLTVTDVYGLTHTSHKTVHVKKK
jgi:subtilase family serine protease